MKGSLLRAFAVIVFAGAAAHLASRVRQRRQTLAAGDPADTHFAEPNMGDTATGEGMPEPEA